MRLFIVLSLAVLVFGTVGGYARFLTTLPEQSHGGHELRPAAGMFSLELVLSFDAGRDGFGFDDDATVLVRMAGQDIIRRLDPVSAAEPLQAEVPGIVAGRNAFFVRAIPGGKQIQRPCAVQLKVLRDGETIAEDTLWSQPGDIVAGEVLLEVEN